MTQEIDPGADVNPLPETAEDVTPTARLVVLALRETDGPMTTRELAEWIQAPPRSVRKAIADLADHGLVESAPIPTRPNVPQHRLLEDRDRDGDGGRGKRT